MPTVPPSEGRRITASLTPASTTRPDLARGWRAAFDLLVDLMAFAHIGLVVKPKDEVEYRADIRILRQAAITSAPKALPSLDGPRPLGTHIELDDVGVLAALRRIGPHVLNVVIYSESDRSLIQKLGIDASKPTLDIDDFGEVLRIDVSRTFLAGRLAGEWTSSSLQAWLDRSVGRDPVAVSYTI